MSFIKIQGSVRLVESMASDIMVVNAARVSFGKRVTEMSPADEGLIGFLMRERHGTPFEHNAFVFHVEAPLFVAREWFRHRIGSFNELSGRYAEIPVEYWKPHLSDIREQTGKAGAYTFTEMDGEVAEWAARLIDDVQGDAFYAYGELLKAGVAKEVARSVLPVGMMTQFYWTVNARSLMNFLSLRTAPTAQKEIRLLANIVETYFAMEMPVTHRAWRANGNVAP